MPIWSSDISQQIHSQTAMFSGNAAYAQQMSYPGQMAAHQGGMPPPPPPPVPPPAPRLGLMQVNAQNAGMYGEQLSNRMFGMGATAGNVAGALAHPLSIGASAGMSAGMAAFATGGLSAGIGMGAAVGLPVAAAAAVPFYVGMKAAQTYGGAFQDGMMQQAATNGVLRSNFNFMGGQGPMGRGFNQQQMGNIGQMFQGMTRQDSFINTGDLNELTQMGAQSGQFTGVRDVQQFRQRFKTMITSLKEIQRELGGSLQEAMSFISESRQVGVFRPENRLQFANEMRGAMATTGMDQSELMQMSMQGAQVSRSIGGLGRQGAVGALRAASTLGSALTSGAINEEALSEATGGLTGSAAIQAMTNRIMGQSARFSRRGMGRYSLFAMSNAEGTGLDAGQMERFMAGDLTVGDVSRDAHRRVGQMGRARAINREGQLRGAMLEEGGLAGQVGMMRLMVGDQVLDQGDDVASLVMQRRFRMSRSEAQVMTGLMRNQGRIADQEMMDRGSASREAALGADIRETRSVDAFMRNLEHTVQEGTGILATRDVGRKFMSRISALTERVLNDVMGTVENSLSQQDQASIHRISTGSGRDADVSRLRTIMQAGGGAAGDMDRYFQSGMLARGGSPADRLRARGVEVDDFTSAGQFHEAYRDAQMASRGILRNDIDRESMSTLMSDPGAIERISRARALARGDVDAFQRMAGVGAGGTQNAMEALAFKEGLGDIPGSLAAGQLMRRGGGQITAGGVGRDLYRTSHSFGLLHGSYAAAAGAWDLATGGTMSDVANRFSRQGMRMETLEALRDPEADRMSFLASGGAVGEELRRQGAVTGNIFQDFGARGNRSIQPGMGRLIGAAAGGGVVGMRDMLVEATLLGAGAGQYIRRSTDDDSQLLSGLQVDDDVMRGLFRNETFQERLTAVLDDPTDRLSQQRYRNMMGTLDAASGEAAAAESVLMNLTSVGGGQEKRKKGTSGPVVNERVARLLRSSLSEGSSEARAQAVDRVLGTAQDLRSIRTNVAEGSTLHGLLTVGEESFKSLADGAGDPLTAQVAMGSISQYMASLNPSSDEYRGAVNQMTEHGGDTGRGIVRSGARRRQFTREATGRGRRGRAGQASALLEGITGGTLGQADIEDARGRRMTNPAQILAALNSRNEETRNRTRNQLMDHMQVNRIEGADELLDSVTQIGSMRPGSEGQNEAVQDLLRQIDQGDSSTSISEAGQRATMEQQRGTDVLGAERNDLLKNIKDSMARVADKLAGPQGQTRGDPP